MFSVALEDIVRYWLSAPPTRFKKVLTCSPNDEHSTTVGKVTEDEIIGCLSHQRISKTM